MADSQESLLDQVRSGANRQLQVLAASGLLPLLARRPDPAAGAARPRRRLRAVAQGGRRPAPGRRPHRGPLPGAAGGRRGARLLRRRGHPPAAPRSRSCGAATCRGGCWSTSRGGSPPTCRRSCSCARTPSWRSRRSWRRWRRTRELSAYTQRRISEYREHLLPRERPAAPPVTPSIPGDLPEIDDATLKTEVETVRDAPGAGGDRRGDRPDRGADPDALGPRPAEAGARRAAHRCAPSCCATPTPRWRWRRCSPTPCATRRSSRSRAAARWSRRSWRRSARSASGSSRYPVTKALVQNPRTPLAVAIKMVNRLSVRDLRDLARDRNVAGRGSLDSPPFV